LLPSLASDNDPRALLSKGKGSVDHAHDDYVRKVTVRELPEIRDFSEMGLVGGTLKKKSKEKRDRNRKKKKIFLSGAFESRRGRGNRCNKGLGGRFRGTLSAGGEERKDTTEKSDFSSEGDTVVHERCSKRSQT